MDNKKPQSPASNLDNWNNRLDDNLEKSSSGDVQADQKAEDFNENVGTAHKRNSGTLEMENDDNMSVNQPKPSTPKPGEINREE